MVVLIEERVEVNALPGQGAGESQGLGRSGRSVWHLHGDGLILGALTLVLTASLLPLAPARDLSDGWQVLLFVAVSLPGVVVARRQPAIPSAGSWSASAWTPPSTPTLGATPCSTTTSTAGTCRSARPRSLVASGLWTVVFLVLPLVILLFPDGRLPRRWRMVLWAYLAAAALLATYFLGVNAWDMSRTAGLGQRGGPADQAALARQA